MVLASRPRLPDAFVGLVPILGHVVAEPNQCPLHFPVKMSAMEGELCRRVDDLSIHVELKLFSSRVSNANRPGSAISSQMFQFAFYGGFIAVKRIQNSQPGLCQACCVQQPV